MNRLLSGALLLTVSLSGCSEFEGALTQHSRPVAAVSRYSLDPSHLAAILAESTIPDSALTEYWAMQFAQIWGEYVALAEVYVAPDSTQSLDYDRLLEDRRYLAELIVNRYRDSVVLGDIDYSEEKVREYYQRVQPFTRLDIRRIVIELPADASQTTLDSLIGLGEQVRNELVGGADFRDVARRVSSEPAQVRGQLRSYQGHRDFPAVADSVLFAMSPGQISPLIELEDGLHLYLVEARRAPTFEQASDQVFEQYEAVQESLRISMAVDSLVGSARRTVLRPAIGYFRAIVSTPDMAADRIPDQAQLVRWDGGNLTAGELRRLLRVRSDLVRLFADSTDEELEGYLFRLAEDEILIAAATGSGIEIGEAERAWLSEGLASQLSGIANNYDISHVLVTHPQFDVRTESVAFLSRVLARAARFPRVGEYQVILDTRYPIVTNDRAGALVARQAGELRRAASAESTDGVDAPAAQTEDPNAVAEDTH
jgi:hypothetical protein